MEEKAMDDLDKVQKMELHPINWEDDVEILSVPADEIRTPKAMDDLDKVQKMELHPINWEDDVEILSVPADEIRTPKAMDDLDKVQKMELHPINWEDDEEILSVPADEIRTPTAMDDLDTVQKMELHPINWEGDVEILSIPTDEIRTPYLPCGLPPILPDFDSTLKAFTQDFESLPILDYRADQRIIPTKPNIRALHGPIELCPYEIDFDIKCNEDTGEILSYTENIRESAEGTSEESMSMMREPGAPGSDVKGSAFDLPFWPAGIKKPEENLLFKEPVDISKLFDGDYLDTPPGFEHGMKFERQPQDDIETLPIQEISLADILSMDDLVDLESTKNEDNTQDVAIALDKLEISEDSTEATSINKELQKIVDLPILKISEHEVDETKREQSKYKWAIIENVKDPVDDFNERIPIMAHQWNFELDIFQKKAILFLAQQENVFVAAHTSAGKTVVAEYAIALAKKNTTRVIYTSPVKALSNQKFRDFKDVFDDVGLITGDVQINATAFCLIMTTEILRSMLYHGSDVIREVEWVIFDEVHYINDAERGVVWEEVFIMLPEHINLIMLSATVPNTAEFAEWLGAIKERKIHVISTLKRPVPLEYYLYTGSVGKAQDQNFLVVDKTGKFQDHMYKQAVDAKKVKSDKGKGKGDSASKGYYGNVSYAQEKNIYIGLLGHLKQRDLLPVVCFTLSRKKCKEHAEGLQSQDLTTAKEKEEIVRFFRRSISKLKNEDKELIQIKTMERQLSLGFGVHHSGILPLLKEVVEILFQRGLIKVLFATETFAMGVNMPARTVVFDSTQKHDGREHRDLKPSEFIQMAGRAGRRGLDNTGTVIILCKREVPNIIALQSMMLGKPTKLESKFKLTYSMMLNLLRLNTLRVEDVMKRSFGESHSQKLCEGLQAELLELEEKLSKISKPDCSLCDIDLKKYCSTVAQIKQLSAGALEKIGLQAIKSRQLNIGRIVTVVTKYHSSVPAVILSLDRDNKCKVLAIDDDEKFDTSDDMTWTKSPYFPDKRKLVIFSVLPPEIHVISSGTVSINSDGIIKDWNKMKGLNCAPGRDIQAAFDSLVDYCHSHLEGFPSLNINFKDFENLDKHLEFKKLNNSLPEFMCLRCPEFSKHCKQNSEILRLEADIDQHKYRMSEESLLLHSEFLARKKVLKSLGYITDRNVVLKGSVAREMSNHELFITELIFRSVLTDCTPAEIAALLSCTVFQQKSRGKLSSLGLSSKMLAKIKEMQEISSIIDRQQNECGVQEATYGDQYNFHLTQVVYDWAQGVSFAEIMKNEQLDVEEGIIVRCIQRLCELLKEVRKAVNIIVEFELAKKIEDAALMIKRDIVFAASLYTQQS